MLSESETEALEDAVRKQVEYYFSKENLQTDAYLTSHMDANMTVSIAIVMKVYDMFMICMMYMICFGFVYDFYWHLSVFYV